MKAFNERDLGTFLSMCDAEIELVALRSAIEGPYRGHAGIRKWWADTAENWAVYRVDVERVHDVGDGTIVGSGVIHAEGRGGGVPLDIPTSWLIEMRNGRGTKTEFFSDQEAAFRAVGVAPKADSERP
jgi:ketosteroid isomerase-like protein